MTQIRIPTLVQQQQQQQQTKVKAIVLDPENQFHVDRQLTKDDVQKLIKVLLYKLSTFSTLFLIRDDITKYFCCCCCSKALCRSYFGCEVTIA